MGLDLASLGVGRAEGWTGKSHPRLSGTDGGCLFPPSLPLFPHGPLLSLSLPALFSLVPFLSFFSCPVHPRWVPSCSPLLTPTRVSSRSHPTRQQVWGSACTQCSSLPVPEPSRASGGCWGTHDEDVGPALQKAVLIHRAWLGDKDKPWQLLAAGKRQWVLTQTPCDAARLLLPCSTHSEVRKVAGTSSAHPARAPPAAEASGGPRDAAPAPAQVLPQSPQIHRPHFQLPAAFILHQNEHQMQQQSRFLLGQVPVPGWRGMAALSPYQWPRGLMPPPC